MGVLLPRPLLPAPLGGILTVHSRSTNLKREISPLHNPRTNPPPPPLAHRVPLVERRPIPWRSIVAMSSLSVIRPGPVVRPVIMSIDVGANVSPCLVREKRRGISRRWVYATSLAVPRPGFARLEPGKVRFLMA